MFYSIRKQYIIEESSPTNSQVPEYCNKSCEQITNNIQETFALSDMDF